MTRVKFYYRFWEAEKLKQTYSSWIDKKAHIGAGQFEVLKRIIITPKRSLRAAKKPESLFHVKFEFKSKKLDAWLFLTNNGLTNSADTTALPGKTPGSQSGENNM